MVDVNVGRLAKWLRVMGYDSFFIPDADDNDLLRVAEDQERIVVTKDRHLAERRAVSKGRVRVVLVASDLFREQMRQISDTLGLDSLDGFSICIKCNEMLTIVRKETVEDSVPPFVFSTRDQFYRCPACERLYWRGTHWNNMRAELAGFTKEA